MESGSNYLVNLWTRQGIDAGMNNEIAEFAPANGDAPITTIAATPEPGYLGLLAAGVIGLFALTKKLKLV